MRSRSQRAAVKVVDYVDWSSEEEEEEEEEAEAPKSRRNDRKKGRSAADEESAWALRLVVIDDEERRYELTGEPFDAPLPPPIKAAKDRQTEGPANEEKGGTDAPEAATNGDGKDAKKRKKETFYAAMKEIEGGQNVGLLEGWWFCLRASNDTHALALGGKKKLTKFPTEGLISCFLSYGPPNVPPKHRTVTYSLEDISYDVQQSHFTALKEKKRQKTGKTYHVDRSSSPTCETDQLVLRIENGKLMAVRLFVELKDLPEAWRNRAKAEERYRETHEVLFRKREESKRVRFDDDRVSVRLYLCNDPPGQHLAEENTQIATEEEKNGRQKLKEKGEGVMLKTVLKTKVNVEDEEEGSERADAGAAAAMTTATTATAAKQAEGEGVQLQLQLRPEEVATKTIRELRAMLKERRLLTVGNKETLIKRLIDGQAGQLASPQRPLKAQAAAAAETAKSNKAEVKERAKPSNKRKRKSEEEGKESKGEDGANEGSKKTKTTSKTKTKEKKEKKEKKRRKKKNEAAGSEMKPAEPAGGSEEKETTTESSQEEATTQQPGIAGEDEGDVRPSLVSLKIGQLKEKCREMKVKCTGKKDELIARIANALAEARPKAVVAGEELASKKTADNNGDGSEAMGDEVAAVQEKKSEAKETKKRKRTKESETQGSPARRGKKLLVSTSQTESDGASEEVEGGGEEPRVEVGDEQKNEDETEERKATNESEEMATTTEGRARGSEEETKQAELKKMKVPELKNLLKEHKLKISGSKEEVVARLMDHFFPPPSSSSSSSSTTNATTASPRAASRKRRATPEASGAVDGANAKAKGPEEAAGTTQKRRKMADKTPGASAATKEKAKRAKKNEETEEGESESEEQKEAEEEEAPPPQSKTSPRGSTTTTIAARGRGRGRGRGRAAATAASSVGPTSRAAPASSPVARSSTTTATAAAAQGVPGSPATGVGGMRRRVGLSRLARARPLHPPQADRRASN